MPQTKTEPFLIKSILVVLKGEFVIRKHHLEKKFEEKQKKKRKRLRKKRRVEGERKFILNGLKKMKEKELIEKSNKLYGEEEKDMKIAISATGKGLDSNIDVKFERCRFFLIVDTEKNTLLPIEC